MKKIFLFSAAIAALSLGSCSNDEVIERSQADAISFRAALSKNTRASETTTTNLEKFKVTALNGSEQFFQQDATKSGAFWVTGSTYYWPTSSTLKFGAWAPFDLTGVTYSETTKKIVDFSPKRNVKNQQDVIVAVNSGNKTANGTSGVPLFFHHALSQIAVEANCNFTDLEVKVMGVKVANIMSKSTFTFPTDKTVDETLLAQNLWSAPSEKTSYAAMGTNVTPDAVTLAAGNFMPLQFGQGNFMVIPQNNTTTAFSKTNQQGTYIGLYVKITNKVDHSLVYPKTGENSYAFVAIPVAENWEPGKKYTYAITFGGADGNGGAGWVPETQVIPGQNDSNPSTPGTAPTGTTPSDNPKGNGDSDKGEPVLDRLPIKFTVLVEDWKDARQTPTTGNYY